MNELKNYIVSILVIIVLVFGARASIFPHIEIDNRTVSIPVNSAYNVCYEQNFAYRKIKIDLKSLNDLPVEAGIIKNKLLNDAISKLEILSRASLSGSYSPSLIKGSISGKTNGDSKLWCAVIKNINSKNEVKLNLTMKVYFRLW